MNPWNLTQTASVQTSRPITCHLLCSDCEQLLNVNGERFVFANMPKPSSGFPFLKLLDSRAAHAQETRYLSNRLCFLAQRLDNEADQLTYFAASIFWRVAAARLRYPDRLAVALGRYQESFRLFLVGQESFPQDAVLSVVIRTPNVISRLILEPYTSRHGLQIRHSFVMPGFAFHLFVGNSIMQSVRNLCFVRGYQRPLIIGQAGEESLFEAARKMCLRFP